jgi:IMP dehydrogenase
LTSTLLQTPKSRLKVAVLEPGQTLTPDEAKTQLQQYRLEKLPLVDRDWRVRGLITARDLYHYLNNPFSSHDRNHQLLVGAAVGVKSGDLDRAIRLVEAGVDCLVVDVAHGHSQLCMDQVRLLRRALGQSHVDIIAGNVATGRGALDLVNCGADAIKVGVGPGSICTTRIVTGCGVPQLSAILDVAAVLNPLKIPFIADGGIK